MANISEIKTQNNVLDYARNILGWDVRSPGDRTYSLDKGGNKTCLVIYEDWWYDFKLNVGGDVIDLCALVRHGGDRGAAIRELGGGFSTHWRDETQNLCNAVALWHESLRPEDWEYMCSRKLTDEYIKKMRLGFDGARLTIPYYKNGYVAYVITRERGAGGSKYKKAKLDGMMENIPWGLHTLDRQTPLVIAEGAFDAMSFDQEGFRVLSPISGFFNKDSLLQVLDICKHAGKAFICFDSDNAGNKFQVRMAQEFFRRHIVFTCGELDVKDVSDYYCAGGKLDILIAGARPGIEVLAERIENKDDFKKFVFEAGRFVGRPEMMEFLEKVKQFPAAWMREVTKQAMSAPPDDLILSEVTERHLKFWDALGFYEYSGGVWRRRTDSEVRKYIADTLGHYQTGSRVSSVFALLKAHCVSTEELDRRPVFVFSNGTLELDTGAFREHREADLCSVFVPYDYEPEAWCPRWVQFVEEVCEGDEQKINLLQEIAGYVLYNDCSLQKCFFLLGDGANGKSVYLDVLAAVFGEGNISNVEMSGLVEPFQRIRLYSSILNISSETQTDVKGAESIFKQLVVGDAVNGCYKGKDFKEFRTRAKFISACNDYIKSRDVTTGFLRRVCFINFGARFVDEPAPGEYKADRDLTKKLQAELPGIFCWVYSGYKILREAKQFSVPGDQAEAMEGFQRDINPVVSFIEDEIMAGEYERGRLYEIYASWCKKCGHLPLSRTAFIRRFKTTMIQRKRKCEEFRTASYRGYIVG